MAKTTRTAPTTASEAPAPAKKPRARSTTTKPRVTKPRRDGAQAADRNVTSKSAKATSVSVVVAEPTEDEIRVRAYHRYLERGGRHGSESDDWLEARRDLLKRR